MVWAAIWMTGKLDLIIIERDYCGKRKGYTAKSYQKALEIGLLSYYDGMRRFQQDNTQIHNFGGTPEWLQSRGIEYIDWPAYSPDLNPMKYVWKALKSNLYKIFPYICYLKDNKSDRAELIKYMKLAQVAIPQTLIWKLIELLPRRPAAVRRARGWYTKH